MLQHASHCATLQSRARTLSLSAGRRHATRASSALVDAPATAVVSVGLDEERVNKLLAVERQRAYQQGYEAGLRARAGGEGPSNTSLTPAGTAAPSTHPVAAATDATGSHPIGGAPEQPVQQVLLTESVQRTAIKGLTWRILSTALTVTLALALLDDVQAHAALELGALEFLSKFGLYFVHERLWTLVTFLV